MKNIDTFLDKIYDRYENYDFNVHDTDLNPKRDPSGTTKENPEEALLKKIKAMVDNIHKTVAPKIGGTFTPEMLNDIPYNQPSAFTSEFPQGAIDRANSIGSLPTDMFGLNGQLGLDNSYKSYLNNEIDYLIGLIQFGIDQQGLTPEQTNTYCVECAKNGDLITFEVVNSAIKNALGMSDKKGIADYYTDSQQIDAILNSINEDLSAESVAGGVKDITGLLFCAQRELGILKIIMMIVSILGMVAKLVVTVVGLVMAIMDQVQLACGSWLNPTNAIKMLERLIQTIISIAISVTGDIISLLLSLLNFDCLLNMSVDLFSEFNATLGATMNIATGLRGDAVSVVKGGKDIKEKGNQFVESLKAQVEANKKFDAESAFGEMGTNLGESAWNDFMAVDAVSKTIATINSVKNTYFSIAKKINEDFPATFKNLVLPID